MKWIILIGLMLAIGFLSTRTAFAGNLPKIGDRAPDFNLPDQNGQFHTLKEYSGKWLVLYFYPKDDTLAALRKLALSAMTCVS